MTTELALSPRDGSVREARHWLAGVLGPIHADRQLEHDVILVLSELVTNAVRHAHTDLVCQVAVTPRTIEIAVIDADPRLPIPLPRDPARAGGFGLAITAGLSSRWGVAEFAGGKAVWASFDVAGPDLASELVERDRGRPRVTTRPRIRGWSCEVRGSGPRWIAPCCSPRRQAYVTSPATGRVSPGGAAAGGSCTWTTPAPRSPARRRSGSRRWRSLLRGAMSGSAPNPAGIFSRRVSTTPAGCSTCTTPSTAAQLTT